MPKVVLTKKQLNYLIITISGLLANDDKTQYNKYKRILFRLEKATKKGI